MPSKSSSSMFECIARIKKDSNVTDLKYLMKKIVAIIGDRPTSGSLETGLHFAVSKMELDELINTIGNAIYLERSIPYKLGSARNPKR
jgi:hypothetical protein